MFRLLVPDFCRDKSVLFKIGGVYAGLKKLLGLLFRDHWVPVRVTLPVTDDLDGAPVLGIDDEGPQEVDGHSLGFIPGNGNNAHHFEIRGLLHIELVQKAFFDVNRIIGLDNLRIHHYEGEIAVLHALQPEEGRPFTVGDENVSLIPGKSKDPLGEGYNLILMNGYLTESERFYLQDPFPPI